MINQQENTLLKAKWLIDGTGSPAQEDAAILIVDGKIREIGHQDQVVAPPGSELIDLGKWTIMPGMVDAHMHFISLPRAFPYGDFIGAVPEVYRALRAAGEARKMLEAGVTAARCLGSSISPHLRRAINEGHVPGPRVVAAGEFIGSTGGTWDHISLPLEWVKAQELVADGVDGVKEMVRRRIRQGADVVKVGLSKGPVGDEYHGWGDDPLTNIPAFSPEEIKALTEEAHLNRLKVSAHCIGDESVRLAIEYKVDTIEHGYGIKEDTRKMLVDRNVIVVTTICQLYYHLKAAEPHQYPAWMRRVHQRHIDAMRADFEKGLAAGVRYALGSDLVGYPTHPQDMAPKEFELATSWGMDPMQAVVAGTKTSAEALSMDHIIGTVSVGKLADIIGFDGDPTKDITVLQRVGFVMQGGQVIVNKAKGAH